MNFDLEKKTKQNKTKQNKAKKKKKKKKKKVGESSPNFIFAAVNLDPKLLYKKVNWW